MMTSVAKMPSNNQHLFIDTTFVGVDDISIFVDASLGHRNGPNNRGGCGLYILDNNTNQHLPRVIFRESVNLGAQTSSTLCELCAIYLAADWVLNNPDVVSGKKICIHSDSQSSIWLLSGQHIVRENSLISPVQKTREHLESGALLCQSLTLKWVRAHAGHFGNYEADQLAKLGSRANLPPIDWPFSDPVPQNVPQNVPADQVSRARPLRSRGL